MWPSISDMSRDMSRDECRKCLRCLELDAYGNMVSVLRAQGPFTEEKRKMLGELAKILHISNERHRAEIRRAVNDEKLSVIAEQLNGPNTYTDWAIEGRRTIPLLPRLKAHTAFTGLANSLSLVIAAANEKKLAPPVSRIDDPIVKSEPASPQDLKKTERPPGKPSILTGDTTTRGRKRKRLSPVSVDNEKCRKTEEAMPELVENISVDERTGSPMQLDDGEPSKVVRVSTVTPSSPAEATSRTADPSQTLPTKMDSNHHKFIAELLENKRCQDVNASSKKLIIEKVNNRQDIPSGINGQETIIAQSEIARILGLEETQPGDDEILKNATQPDKSTKISRPDGKTSTGPKKSIANELCVSAKPIISTNTNCALTINSTGPHGPVTPSVSPTETLTCKTIAAEKLNHLAPTKMGVTLNSSKTLKLNAHPTNARLSRKANVILVQKGSSRGVTLSHGGKEVLGKVIMGGKNLCLASQKKKASVMSNGELTLTSFASNHAENIKLGAKTGNLIMLDIRQDSIDDAKVLEEYLESPEPHEAPETSIGLKNSEDSINNRDCASENSVLTKNSESLVLNGSRLESSEKLENFQEDCTNFSAIDGSLEPEESTGDSATREGLQDPKIQVEQVLEPSTYDYESTEEIIIEEQIEESIETSGMEIFGGSLECPGINLENVEYVNEEEQEIIIETSDEILEEEICCEVAETIDRLSDS